MLKQVYKTNVGTFETVEAAFEAEWTSVLGGRRFLRMFDEQGKETFSVKEAAFILYRSEKAHQLIKDYLSICGWTERNDNDSKRGLVYGMGFVTACGSCGLKEVVNMNLCGELSEIIEAAFN